jgi:hypothetical protein
MEQAVGHSPQKEKNQAHAKGPRSSFIGSSESTPKKRLSLALVLGNPFAVALKNNPNDQNDNQRYEKRTKRIGNDSYDQQWQNQC